jgi:glycyl-tRNA synthetase beta chain
MAEFFLEIGAEEIPAGYIKIGYEYLEKELLTFLDKKSIPKGEASSFGTSRRLVLSIADIAIKQEDVLEKHLGPNVKNAYDADGNPTKAAIGFARGKGIDVGDLMREETPKGEVICAKVEKKGEPTVDLLNGLLPSLISAIPFPKKMKWGNKKLDFARPVLWIVAVFDGQIMGFEWNGMNCQDKSFGHRFLKPEPFVCGNLKEFLQECEARYIVPDWEKRKRIIWDGANRLAGEVGGLIIEDKSLLEEVAGLVEFPTPLRCEFEEKFLELPKELLEVTMKKNQRYFPVSSPDHEATPYFIAISNMNPEAGDQIKRGNERVLRARLEDAQFFFEEDKKHKLEDFIEPLKGIVFQKKLGTVYEKVERTINLSGKIAKEVSPESEANAIRAAKLCKADLNTLMVFEFPEMQGIAGGYYSIHSGEDEAVSIGIKEHYQPAFSGDDSPSTNVGAVVAIADKLDTIVGCISVGLIPSGSEDPYALRRHSLGIIQIILDKNWQVSLNDWISAAINNLSEKATLPREEIEKHIEDLFAQRFRSMLRGQDHPYDVIDAVLSVSVDSPTDVGKKVEALSELKELPYFEPLAVAFKRVVSILTPEAEGEVDPTVFNSEQEKDLYDTYLSIRKPVDNSIRDKDFRSALKSIVQIKESVDAFFENVMVMDKDEKVKVNRLRLLKQISLLFSDIADFSKLVVKKS